MPKPNPLKSFTPSDVPTRDTSKTLMSRHRNPRSGFALLATLAFLLLLAAITITVQAQSQRNLRLLSRLTHDLQDRAARDALYDLLRTPLAYALASPTPQPGLPRLNSTPFQMEWNNQNWQVRVQDVEGLVDLYIAPESTLALLPIDARAVAARRQSALSSLPEGARFPTLSLTLANFGIDPAAVHGMVTQSGSTGFLRLATLPEVLKTRSAGLLPGPRETEQVTRVTLRIEKLP